MIDLKQYVSDATRTESRIEKVEANYITLVETLTIIIAAGTMLDKLKKNIFYKKPIDKNEMLWLNQQVSKASSSIYVQHSLSTVDVTLPTQTVNVDPRVFHAIVGAITESAELAEALQKKLAGHEIDFVNVLEEFGDINWYEAIAVDALGGDFQQILERNIAKLKARFPDKFTNENAINRDLDKERAILEGKTSDVVNIPKVVD